jgi:hypothetical protein
MKTKVCTKCGKEKPLSDFSFRYRRKGQKPRPYGFCTKCKHKQNVEYALKKKIRNGTLFESIRKVDPKRADRLESLSKKAKLGLPM